MNFISQYLSGLTSGGKLYLAFQIVYILCGIVFLYVQISIMKELKILNKSSAKSLKISHNKIDESSFNCHDDYELYHRHGNHNL